MPDTITLSQPEPFLIGTADIPRGGMDCSKLQGFKLGMLFIKRLSDQFDVTLERRHAHDFAHLKAQPGYDETLFAPLRAAAADSHTSWKQA